ncbi:MAG: hypothetical protein KGN02_15380 [bacterium]|nr:hypothetical protein [bacterium]
MTQDDRRLADELVRSYLGEALALARTRLGELPDALESRFGDIILRAGFRNQIAFKAFEYATLDGARVARVAANDARLLELAEQAAAVSATDLPAYLDTVVEAFDARDREMQSNEAAA